MPTSIEHGRALAISSLNPFDSETALYEKLHSPSDIPVTVVVPDFYEIALPNIGHQMVEHQLNQCPGFYADRAYLNHDYSLLKEKKSIAPEMIFISMSYEGSYIRALRMLKLMGCPPRRKDRTSADPLVIIGGWSVSRNPLPLFDIADVIGIGDSEQMVADISSSYRTNRSDREQLFDKLVDSPGFIIPSRYRVSTENGYLTQWEASNAPKDIYPAPSSAKLPHSWYLSPDTDYNTIGYYERKTFFSLEIVDACASKCLYCASGFKTKGRDIQSPTVVADLAEWATNQGADLAKLFFPANSSQSATKAIMKELLARGISPRVGSAKAEKIDDEYIALVGKSGQEKIAFAPETGDYNLRRHLGKPGMTNDVLKNVIVSSVLAGIPNLDFYLIMNLPGEAPDSFDKSIDMLGEFYQLAISKGLKGRIRMSAPNFFPKASTPFQYAESGQLDSYAEKIVKLEHALSKTVAVSSMKGSTDLLSQNVMSRGGIEVGELLIEVNRILEQREIADGAFIADTIEDWRLALANLGLDERSYFEQKNPENKLPWHHIHCNASMSLDSLMKAWTVFQHKRAMLVID